MIYIKNVGRTVSGIRITETSVTSFMKGKYAYILFSLILLQTVGFIQLFAVRDLQYSSRSLAIKWCCHLQL